MPNFFSFLFDWPFFDWLSGLFVTPSKLNGHFRPTPHHYHFRTWLPFSNYRYDKPCTYYDAILPLRVLLLKYTNPKVFQLIMLLMDHNDQLDANAKKRRQTLVDFLRKSCKLADDFTDNECHRVLGILSVNSFVVHDGGGDETNCDLIGKHFMLYQFLLRTLTKS